MSIATSWAANGITKSFMAMGHGLESTEAAVGLRLMVAPAGLDHFVEPTLVRVLAACVTSPFRGILWVGQDAEVHKDLV